MGDGFMPTLDNAPPEMRLVRPEQQRQHARHDEGADRNHDRCDAPPLQQQRKAEIHWEITAAIWEISRILKWTRRGSKVI